MPPRPSSAAGAGLRYLGQKGPLPIWRPQMASDAATPANAFSIFAARSELIVVQPGEGAVNIGWKPGPSSGAQHGVGAEQNGRGNVERRRDLLSCFEKRRGDTPLDLTDCLARNASLTESCSKVQPLAFR